MHLARNLGATIAALFMVSISYSDPITLYDNGSVIEADLGIRFNYNQWSVYDDFVLSEDSTVSGFAWSQFDELVVYENSVISVYSGLPTPSTLITTIAVEALRVSNGLMLSTNKVPSGLVHGFDYLVDGLSLELPAGTYYLGIWNAVSGGATLVANTPGSGDNTPGFYQHNGGGPPDFGLTESGPTQFNNSNIPFLVRGRTGRVKSISIDIKPYNKKNRILPRSRGVISVAALGSQEFDALQIDPETARFGPGEAAAIAWLTRARDVNRDGFIDMILRFKTRKSGIECGDSEATLTGQTYAGDQFSGTDDIVTKGCNSSQ
jgi:hypothetical protein